MGKFTVEEGALAAKQFLGVEGLRPSVFICANHLLAIGAMNACRSFGLDCPRDISITGFNDIEFAKYLSPQLTTVTRDAYAIGFKSATVLLDQLETHSTKVKNIKIMPQLQERGSLRAIDPGA